MQSKKIIAATLASVTALSSVSTAIVSFAEEADNGYTVLKGIGTNYDPAGIIKKDDITDLGTATTAVNNILKALTEGLNSGSAIPAFDVDAYNNDKATWKTNFDNDVRALLNTTESKAKEGTAIKFADSKEEALNGKTNKFNGYIETKFEPADTDAKTVSGTITYLCI